MSIRSTAPYNVVQRDQAKDFPAPLLYIGWDDHLMFCAPFCVPLPAGTPFRDVVKNVLPQLYGDHPDFAHIDWERVQWYRGDDWWMPKMDRSLEENGLSHKSFIRMKTPGLSGLAASGS